MSEYVYEVTGKTPDSGRKIAPASWVERLLRRVLPYKEIGWQDIGEVFYRYQIVKTRWFNVYLHQLDAPQWHPVGCHDHPWGFVTVLLSGGYLERTGDEYNRRYAGQVLYRPATHLHDVTTPYGRSWSLIVTGKKSRTWGFKSCEA
jgi:hypothetical protein